MKARTIWRAGRAALALASAAAGTIMAGPAAAEIVYCYDPGREIVRRTDRAACAGEVVTAAEAAEIQARRARYVRGAVQAEPPPRPDKIGTGIFVSGQGHVLTNRHVIGGCERLSVLAPGGQTLPATVAAVSGRYDLALLRVPLQPKATAVLAAGRLAEGDPVAMTGFPVRTLPRVRPTTIDGLYLGMIRKFGMDDVLVLAGQVRGGSSGSGVVDRAGAVIGVVFGRSSPTAAALRGGGDGPAERVYAIPAQVLQTLLAAWSVPFRTGTVNAAAPGDYTVRVNCQ